MQRIELRKVIDPLPIYTMWLREMKRFVRIKARIVGSLSMPFLILVFLGLPMRSVLVEDIDFLSFLAPGIVGMTLLFSATMAGASILWDKEFGFLKEVLVAPVNRFSVMLGRSLGGITITTIQAMVILGAAVAMGVKLSSVVMLLTCATFTGFGLILGTRLTQSEGLMAIMPLITLPIMFLSGAFFPMSSMPSWVRYVMYINPLTYGVDGLRGTLIGPAAAVFPLWLNFVVLLAMSLTLAALGAYFFSRMEAD
jgi:ABC-2 type transport system permease protein